MSENLSRIPRRRFKEFKNADAWEQRKLRDIAESFSGGTPSVGNKAYYGGKIPFIRSGEINSSSTELFLTEEGLCNSSAKEVKEGDILYALYGATSGEVGISQINGAINQAILAIRPNNKYNSIFIAYWLRKQKYHIVNTFLQGGQGNLSGAIINDLIISIPENLEEQIIIGELFANLDNFITLHQRKLDKLKAMKSAFLTEMFPAQGKRQPRRRFVGFTEDWEQRKVNDLFKVTRGYVLATSNTSSRSSEEVPYPVYSSQTKENGLMGYHKNFLYEDAITWTTDGANAGTVNYRTGKFFCTNVCGVLLSNGVKANQMIAEALNNVTKKYVSYVGNPKLMNNIMAEIEIQLPNQENERVLISEFLCNVDNLITLHQRKLNKLQDLKKAYLNEMFI